MRRFLLGTAVVVGHAAIQAALVVPRVAVTASPGFGALLAASTLALVAAVVSLVILAGTGGRPRIGRVLVAVVVALIVIAALAVLSAATLVPAVLIALVVVSPLGNAGAAAAAGPASFAAHPIRAVLAAVLSMVVLALIGVAALLFGFLVTGWLGALATGIVGGALLALLVRMWARLAVRPRREGSRVRPAVAVR